MKAVTVLLFGLGLGLSSAKASCGKPGGPEATADSSKPATETAPVSLEGVNTNVLTPRERKEFSGYVTKFEAPCSDFKGSVAACIQSKNSCKACLPAAQFVLRAVRDGKTDTQIADSFKNRFDASKVRVLPVDGSPSRGPEDAKVTIVEFADFACPHCASVAPGMDKIFEERKDKIRFVYKFVNLQIPGHELAEPASRAAFAAFRQGKFWEMNAKLFANQPVFAPADLQKYATELNLDVAKFKADSAGNEATDRIAKDRKLTDEIELKGTPSIYINGRLFDGGDLPGWVDMELAMNGVEPPTKTTGTLPAAPSGALSGDSVKPAASAPASAAASAKPAK